MQQPMDSGEWDKSIDNNAVVRRMCRLLGQSIDFRQEARDAAVAVRQFAGRSVRTTVWAIVRLLIALFALS